MLDGRAERKLRAEIGFVIDDMEFGEGADAGDVLTLLNDAVERAGKRGFGKLQEQKAEQLARSLRGGAGLAHKMANVDNALPTLRLVIECKK